MRAKLLLFLCLLLSASAFGQFTLVSGTVTDPNGLLYAGGTITPTLVISGSPKFTATNLPYTPPTQAVGLGLYTNIGAFSMQLADVTALTPSGGTWSFQVCSAQATVPPAFGKGPQCFTVTGITISGSSQNLSSTLSAAAPALTATFGSGGSGCSLASSNANAVVFLNASSNCTSAAQFTFVPGTGISANVLNVGNTSNPGTLELTGPSAFGGVTELFGPGVTFSGNTNTGVESGAYGIGPGTLNLIVGAPATVDPCAIGTISRTSNVVTATCGNGDFPVGSYINVSGVTNSTYNGRVQILTASWASTTETITYASSGTNGSSSGGFIAFDTVQMNVFANAGSEAASSNGAFIYGASTQNNDGTAAGINLIVGNALSNNPGGPVNIIAGGGGPTSNQNGGSITLTPGAASGSGTPGQVNLGPNANVTRAGALTVTSCTGCGSGGGTVTSVGGTNGITGGPITGSGNLALGGALESYPNAVTVSGTNNIYLALTYGNDMGATINAAIAANGSGHVYNARGFTGNQVWLQTNSYGETSVALYGGAAIGTEVDATLLLSSSLNLYVDGVAGNFTDGVSNFGTPGIIVPWGFKIEYLSPIGHFVAPCTGANTPVTGCTHAFPVRSFSVSSTTVAGNTLTGNTTGIVTSGGPAGNQNLYVKELAALTSPSCLTNNLLRTIQSITATTFTISVPSTTASCGSTGTLYLATPMFGFGLQNSGTGYEPIAAGQQAFGSKLINVNVDMSSVLGLVAFQNVNQGEQSEIKGYYCRHPAFGCLEVLGGANDSGPYDDGYLQTLSVTTNVNPTTFGIFNAAATRGYRGFTGNIATSLNGTAFEPNACVYNDGNAVAFTGEFHCEGPVDLFEVGMDNNVGAMHVSVSLGAPSSNPNVNQVHVVNDGYTVSGSIFEMVGTQPSGGTNAIKDDQNSVTVTDSALTMYTLTNNGTQVWIGGNGNITAAGGLNGNNLNISGTNCSSVSLPLSAGQGCLAAGSTQGTFIPTRVNTGASAAAIAEVQVGDCASPTTITGSATTATIAYSDSVGCVVRHDRAGSASATITIPVPTGGTSLNNAHPFFTYENDSTHSDTLSPTTYQISLANNAAASTLAVPGSVSCKIALDPTNASTWKADCHPIATSASGSQTLAMLGGTSNLGAGGFTGTNYSAITGPSLSGTITNGVAVPCQPSCTAKNFYVQLSAVVPTGLTYTYTVMTCPGGGVSCTNTTTSITCAIAAAASACNDTTHTQSYTAGDLIYVKEVQTGSGTEVSANQALSIQFQ